MLRPVTNVTGMPEIVQLAARSGVRTEFADSHAPVSVDNPTGRPAEFSSSTLDVGL